MHASCPGHREDGSPSRITPFMADDSSDEDDKDFYVREVDDAPASILLNLRFERIGPVPSATTLDRVRVCQPAGRVPSADAGPRVRTSAAAAMSSVRRIDRLPVSLR